MHDQFVMPVGAIFSVNGGRIASGRIQRGRVAAGHEVEIVRAGRAYRGIVASVQTFDRVLPSAQAGQDVGLVLTGDLVAVVQPGDVLTAARPLPPRGPSAFPAQPPSAPGGRARDGRFAAVEAEYARLRDQLIHRRITPAQLDASLSALMFELDGRYWMIGANSGLWYASAGEKWVAATPPQQEGSSRA